MPFFFYPDYTVGSGVPFFEESPNQPLARVADYTASEELHLALKNFSNTDDTIAPFLLYFKIFLCFMAGILSSGLLFTRHY